MKILIEVDSNDINIGAVNDVLDLARFSRNLGLEYYLAGPLDDNLSSAAISCGMKLVSSRSKPISKRNILSYSLNVIRWIFILKKIAPDVVHLNYISWGPSLGMASYICGIPVVARAGGTYNAKNLTHRWVSRYIANCAQQGEALSQSVLSDNVIVAGDLVNTERFHDILPPINPYPEKTKGVIRFLFLGQLVERKGIDVLIKAFANIPPNSELLLVGGDWDGLGFPQKIKKMIHDFNLTDRVYCLNHRKDAISILKDCDIFVLPSLSEARPRSIIEAMLMGKCILTTEVGGIPTLINHGETGLLVKANDSLSLGEAMEKLMMDKELRYHLSTRAQDFSISTFDPVKTVKNYIDIYTEVKK